MEHVPVVWLIVGLLVVALLVLASWWLGRDNQRTPEDEERADRHGRGLRGRRPRRGSGPR
jgi:hypothetical protein